MTPADREALIRLLADLVADGTITEEQAAGILLFAAELTGAEQMIPLPSAGPRPIDDDDEAAILILLAAATGIASLTSYADLRRLSRQRRTAAADALADWHQDQADDIARALRAGNVRTFQTAATDLNRIHAAAQAALGARGLPPALRQALADAEAEDSAYLGRFADGAGLRELIALLPPETIAALGLGALAARYSQAYLASRLAMYGARGRAGFFRAAEEYDGESAGYGWVVRYVARDDDATCGPCSEAQGYYLPGDGPYPGEVCLGRHRCRCRRVSVYAPDVYESLI